MSVLDEKLSDDLKHDPKHEAHVAVSAVDTAAVLVSGDEFQLDPQEALRIRRKIDRHIMPLMCGTLFALLSHSFVNARQSCIGSSSWTRLRSEVPLS
jgi:hypothetical protein